MKNYAKLQEQLGYEFKNLNMLQLALTHSSWANERHKPGEHNERLEFLGDAVLELCVSSKLYRQFPQAREGELTYLRARLVSEKSLANIAREVGLQKMLLLGAGEEKQGGRERDAILCDGFEAILGAAYEDGGLEAAKKILKKCLAQHWPRDWRLKPSRNAKSRLQEFSQEKFKKLPIYTLENSSGPEHEKIFEIRLVMPDGQIFRAKNSSCKKAEQDCAAMALEAYEAALACQGGSQESA